MYQYVKQHCNHDFKNRITIANVEFDCSTEKISSMEFSMERPKINGKACVYRGFRKNKKNSIGFSMERQWNFQWNF